MELHEKLELLKNNIKKMESLTVAFSGGVDSAFLLKVAHDVLGDNVFAITARSAVFPAWEFEEAVEFAKGLGVKHEFIVSEELDSEAFRDNPPNRCYLCKLEIFTKILEASKKEGINFVADGSNVDDLGDYRPGLQALKELNIVSPLREAGLTKMEIRELSNEMKLPTWDKPSYACLASRFPYGVSITKEKLKMVEKAEQFLLDKGLRQIRVRHHGDLARIEVESSEFGRFFDDKFIGSVYKAFRDFGYTYVSLDLKGYRTGSMNETLSKQQLNTNQGVSNAN